MEYTPLPDEDLVARIARGDREALGLIYDRYARVIFSVSVRLLGDRGVAEEITQEVFLSLWLRAGTYRAEKGKFSTWLFSIAHNRAVDTLRRRRREGIAAPADTPDLEQIAADGPDLVQQSARAADRHLVRQALDRLPQPQRDVLVLSYYQGLTHVEIANHLSVPLGTVKTRMRLGLLKLKDLLKNLNNGENGTR